MRRRTRTDLRSRHSGMHIEMTFRGTSPLDELVDAVRSHATSLEPLCCETAVCRVGVHGLAPAGDAPGHAQRARYLVELRLTDRGGYCEVRGEGTDPFDTLGEAFARLDERLRVRTSTAANAAGAPGERAKDELARRGGAPAGPHDGWVPVRARRADESMRDLPL